MRYIALVLILIAVSSCCSDRYVARVAKRCPDKLINYTDTIEIDTTIVFIDTIHIYDTIITKPVSIDTTWFARDVDSLKFSDQLTGARVKIYKDGNNISLKIDIDPDTIFYEKIVVVIDSVDVYIPLPVDVLVECPEIQDSWWKAWLGAGLMLLFIIAIRYIVKK